MIELLKCLRRPVSFSKLKDKSKYHLLIHKLIDSKQYDKLRRFDISFLYEDENKHNCAGHVGVLMGLYAADDSPDKKIGALVPDRGREELKELEDGCLVVYRDGHERHYGVFKDGRVISKWATGPNPVFSHSVEAFQYVYYTSSVDLYRINRASLESYLS